MTLYHNNIGKIGEQKAIIYLKKHNYLIIKKNYRSKYGEIDIVAEKNKSIYFIEVKTRTDNKYGEPWEAINKHKLLHLKKAANNFLLNYKFKEYKLKLSAISILLKNGEEVIKFFENIE